MTLDSGTDALYWQPWWMHAVTRVPNSSGGSSGFSTHCVYCHGSVLVREFYSTLRKFSSYLPMHSSRGMIVGTQLYHQYESSLTKPPYCPGTELFNCDRRILDVSCHLSHHLIMNKPQIDFQRAQGLVTLKQNFMRSMSEACVIAHKQDFGGFMLRSPCASLMDVCLGRHA